MGKVEIIGKWNLDNEVWEQPKFKREKGRSFSFANYNSIMLSKKDGSHLIKTVPEMLQYNKIKVSGKGINYVIIAPGVRLEDCSNDFETTRDSYANMGRIVDYFEKSDENVIVKMFLMDADAPIDEDAKKMAQYIDILAANPSTDTISLVGLSKCGAMSFYTPKYFKNPNSFIKTNIYTIAAPYNGTLLASPKIFYPEIKNFVANYFGNGTLTEKIYEAFIKLYESISSNSHMDYDIAMPGAVFERMEQCYDPNFIKNIFSDDNIGAIEKVNTYHNMITGIDDKTMREAITHGDFTGIGLCLLDKFFFDEPSDGMVAVSSQRLVERKVEHMHSHKLISSHHNITSCLRVLNDVLHVVDDTIGEQNEKIRYLSKKS